MSERPIIVSYRGGTQSTAIAVLVAEGKLPRPERFVIADTGREATETWEYLANHVQPYLIKAGFIVEIASHELATVDIFSHKGDLLMPVFTTDGKLPTFCSTEWKKRVLNRYLRNLGYGQSNPVVTWIGITLDEIGRAKPNDKQWNEYKHPLLDIGEIGTPYRRKDGTVAHALRREDCIQIVMDAGLPKPPKSSCWMCPHRQNAQWKHLRDNFPADWQNACELDDMLRQRDVDNGRGGVFLHKSRIALRDADLEDVPVAVKGGLFGEVDGCDSGLCWT